MFLKRITQRGLCIGAVTMRCRRTSTSSASLNRLTKEAAAKAARIKETELFTERSVTKKQDAIITINDKGLDFLNLSSSDYLGLSCHPEVVAAGKKAWNEYGVGMSSCRAFCGTQPVHKDLEAKISRFHGTEDTMLYTSCFAANAGIFEALLSQEDAVLSDEFNHASIIDGIRLCRARKYIYKHLDMVDLERKLQDSQNCTHRLIVTDGVFSVDGDLAPLVEICDLAEKYGALVLVDDCHGTGILGKTGRGTCEMFNVEGKTTLINSTLGKAVGAAIGGYTSGPTPIINYLKKRSRSYIFTNGLPPVLVACASKVFDLLMMENDLPKQLLDKTKRFRCRMTEAGFTVIGDNHPICPVMIEDTKLVAEIVNDLLAMGIYVVSIVFPVVPLGTSRIRVQISTEHTFEDIDRAVDAFIQVGKRHRIIS